MDEKRDGVIRRNVSLQSNDFHIVQAEAQERGLAFSTQLGVIIREWVQAQRLLLMAKAYAEGFVPDKDALAQLKIVAQE